MTTGAGVREYAKRVGKGLRDRPADERDGTVNDLAARFTDSGLTTYVDCVERHGKPAAYASELRESLHYQPLRRRRTVPIILGGLVALIIGGGVLFVGRDHSPNPDTFAPIAIGSSGLSGPSVTRLADVVVLTVRPTPGEARLDVVLTNTSSFDLRVESLGAAEFTWGKEHNSNTNDPGPGRVTFNDIWRPTVLLGDLQSPTSLTVGDLSLPMYKPFQPFTWKAHQSIYVVMAGDVSACPAALASLNQGGGPIALIRFTAGDAGFIMSPFPSQLIVDDCFLKR
jgi:hypothetical protein